MVEFPEEGVYVIKTVTGLYATTLEDENMLRGESYTVNKWQLKYIDYDGDDSERVCLLSEDGVDCHCYIGASSIENNIPLYRGKKPQLWYLKKQSDGISISQVSSGIVYAWSLAATGSPIVLSDKATSGPHWQSWEFVPN